MFPKEHGAYGQLIFPLATSLLVAGVTAPALLTALAAGAAFISHEPALVLLGRRGTRATRETGRRAIVWWSVSTAAAVVAGGLALWLAPGGERWAFAYPAVPAAILAVAAGIGVFGAIGDRFARDRGFRTVAGAIQQRITLQFLLDEGRKVEIRQLQKFDRLH